MYTNRLSDVPFTKSNCFGNSFVIIDEIDESHLDEHLLPTFAREVLDPNFGIGADNLLVIQACKESVIESINHSNQYWESMPKAHTDYIFRMFETDGEEALCCGNGLMCVANYLRESHDINSASIMTEIPLPTTNAIRIGTSQLENKSWVNLGIPRKVPSGILRAGLARDDMTDMDYFPNIAIKVRKHDLQPYTDQSEFSIQGYLVFTGEPHLVLLLEQNGISMPNLGDAIFANTEGSRGAGPIFQRRMEFGNWMVNRIGHYVNKQYKDTFPIGVNINFVRRNPEKEMFEYRCFERGIYKETLACGTGAMAVAYVTGKILGIDEEVTRILPHRCRWYRENSEIAVTPGEQGWVLGGEPAIVAGGIHRYSFSADNQPALPTASGVSG